MRKIPILMLLLLLIWSSCDDNESLSPYTVAKGIVKDAGTGTPLANATVYLIEGEWSLLSSGGGYSYVLDSFTTDSDGAYEFRFLDKDDYKYSITASKADYWDLSSAAIVPLPYQENIMDVHLYPFAWLNIHIKNVNPFDENDNIQYDGSWSGGNPQDNIGMAVDFYDLKKLKGNKDIELTWWVVRNNQITQFHDTIYCTGGDTTYYEIFY
jgi:hypothetical protein